MALLVPGRRGSGPVRTSRIVEYREESIALLPTAAELKSCWNNLRLAAISSSVSRFEALGKMDDPLSVVLAPASVIKLHQPSQPRVSTVRNQLHSATSKHAIPFMPPIPPPLAPSAYSAVNPKESRRHHPPHPLNINPRLRNPDASAQKTPPAPTRSSPRLPGSGE